MTSSIPAKARQTPRGVFCPVVSLYTTDAQQDIDYPASYNYFSYLIRAGCHGLVLAGSTAEAVLLSSSEKQDLLRTARRAATDLGISDYPLVAGVSGQSTIESIRLAKEAADSSANFGLLLPQATGPRPCPKTSCLTFIETLPTTAPSPSSSTTSPLLPPV